MTFEEFCARSSFTIASGRELEMMVRGQREYVAGITASSNVIVRLKDTHDDVYMAGVERETKKALYDRLRREFAYDVGSDNYRTGDGTLHMQLEVVPERIDVTQPDRRGREVYSAKVHRFEPERGECRNISDPPEGFLCSECGWGDFAEPSHLLTSACYAGLDKGPRYCPNCGAKVVDA